MLRSNSKQYGKSIQSVLKKKRKGCGGKDLQKQESFFKNKNIKCIKNIIKCKKMPKNSFKMHKMHKIK